MSPATRRDYLAERREYLIYARRHKANPPPDCTCHLCMTVAQFDALIGAKLDAQAKRNGPAPF